MSSFIVTNKTINNILSFLIKYKTDNKVKHFINSTKINYSNMNEAGKMLLLLNNDAVNQRYNTEKDIKIDFKFNKTKCTDAQSYMSLRCFTYQCNEGNISKKLLYLFLDQLEKEMPRIIIENSKQYKNARWN